jgi:putative transposase
MKAYKFKLYFHKRNRYLKRTINAAGVIYNHCIALHKRYYRMFGKYLNCARLQKHIAKMRKRIDFWQLVGSQAVQDICQRIDKAYQLFFKYNKRGVRPPSFKKVRRYKSFTLKQAGYKFLGGNRIKIGNKVYQYWNSQEIDGEIKTVTVKRSPLGELFLLVVADGVGNGSTSKVPFMTGKTAGFDFGLKTFLTTSDGEKIESPQFLKNSMDLVRKASRNHSRKKKGSANRERARKALVRVHEMISNQRRDWFWKLAHRLTDQYDELYFETLNLDGMKRLWGRKISDLAFAEFLGILKWVAEKKGKFVGFVDRWFPSSKTCSHCGHIHKELELSDRWWRCPSCHSVNDRDENAAVNINVEGASRHYRLGDVRQAPLAVTV